MNKRIYKLLEPKINKFESQVSWVTNSNTALFKIFDTFFCSIGPDKKLQKKVGLDILASMKGNQVRGSYELEDSSIDNLGVSYVFDFDGVRFSIRFTKFREQDKMVYRINIKSSDTTKYSSTFMYKYLLYNALESSNLKGAYFSMPRNVYEWNLKEVEDRSFDDIFLPEDITLDLKLYVDIYKENNRLLRYLKVGNPVGKTESTIVIAKELNKLGVTIIKTPIDERIHDKVELANVLAPSLIIFDDIDLSLGDRNKGAYSQLLGDFLDVLDGTDKLSKNVGVIATTNAAHLLDLAAQRPGRFDKTLLFNNITKDNIRNIIYKSLRINFDITKGKEYKLYSDDKVVNKFYDAAVSGAHIFNSIMMLKLRYDTLKMSKDITQEIIVNSIEADLNVQKEVRKISFLKEKYERESGGIGFKSGSGEMVPGNAEVTEGEMIERDESNRPYH